jgi:hypothetical protein
MYTKRVTLDLVIILMAWGLVLGGLALPAAAKTIVVTTLTDTADPPFDADGPCGAGTINDLPGADGLVSLREAIIAANNTNGADTITFSTGGVIIVNFDDVDADANPDPLPALCGGQTRINGDLDGDDVPDIILEGAALPFTPPFAAGISIISSHNALNGLQVQHFPFGIRIRAGDFMNQGTVTHTRVTNNILAEARLDGILIATGNIPDSCLAHTTITHNLVRNNARVGITVLANLSAAGADTQIHHTTITDNEVTGSGLYGIFLVSQGDHNVVSDATLARNTVSGATSTGITIAGGFTGGDHNAFEVDLKDNLVTDNGFVGIGVLAGGDNSSNNYVTARIRGNTVERNQVFGIAATAGLGVDTLPIGASNNNVLDVWIEHNTVRDHLFGSGILVNGGVGSGDGRPNAIADGNHTKAVVKHNVVEGNAVRGISLFAGGSGLASDNTVEGRVAHNTVCHNGDDIVGEGGFTGSVVNPTPNMGAGNVLTGKIFQNTADTVTVADGTPGNVATVMQFNNDPCP